MRKLIALVAVAAVALAAPTAVGAGTRAKYKGQFEEAGTMSFTLKQGRAGKVVINYSWAEFPLQCQGGAETTSGFLAFKQEVNNQRFAAEALDEETNSRLSMRGELIGPRRAAGTLRIKGDTVPIDGGGTGACESGIVEWTARKG